MSYPGYSSIFKRKIRFESHLHFLLLDRGGCYAIKTPSTEVEERGGGGRGERRQRPLLCCGLVGPVRV